MVHGESRMVLLNQAARSMAVIRRLSVTALGPALRELAEVTMGFLSGSKVLSLSREETALREEGGRQRWQSGPVGEVHLGEKDDCVLAQVVCTGRE